MPGPDEWRPRAAAARSRACTESGLSARFTFFSLIRGAPRATADRDESRRTNDLAGAELGARGPPRLPGHARAVLDRHLPARVHRHRAGDRRVAGRDAADAVGVPVRLRGDEPLPRR